MIKDIEHPAVTGIAVAIVPDEEAGEKQWSVYLLNLKHTAIDRVLVSASGTGEILGRKKETTTLRYFIERIEGRSFARLEHIIPEAFQLTNRYWVSYYEQNRVHDKKYIFVPESIDERNFTHIPLLNRNGVMIK